MEISEHLAAALHELVQATEATEAAPSDRQVVRRAVEQASVVVHLARHEGFGHGDVPGDMQGVTRT